jgi:hypothetical protein
MIIMEIMKNHGAGMGSNSARFIRFATQFIGGCAEFICKNKFSGAY